ncbi:MAG: glycosyltransferase family 4 protein [Candidatus Goldiibacteriota bacterium]
MVKNSTGKKKILFVEYFPLTGGGQVVLAQLIKKLKKDYDVNLLILNKGPITGFLNEQKIKYDFIQAPKSVKFRYLPGMLGFERKLLSYLADKEPDLISANCYFAAKLCVFPAGIRKIPVIWHKHITIEKKYFSYLSSQIRFYSRFVKKIICVSEAVKETMKKAGVKEEKLAVVHNGVELPDKTFKRSGTETRKRHGVKDSEFLVGAVGFLRKNKGFELFIDAAGIVVRKKKNIRFMIAGSAEKGDEEYAARLKKRAENLNLGKKFIFAGHRDRYEYMPAFDLLCVPSYNEPFGMVTIEASALGVPAIAFNTGGSKEIITHKKNGFLAGKTDAASLAAGILEAEKDRERLGKISRAAAENVKDNFTLEKQAAEIRGIIEKAV